MITGQRLWWKWFFIFQITVMGIILLWLLHLLWVYINWKYLNVHGIFILITYNYLPGRPSFSLSSSCSFIISSIPALQLPPQSFPFLLIIDSHYVTILRYKELRDLLCVALLISWSLDHESWHCGSRSVDWHCMYEWDLEQELLGLEAMLDLTKEWEVGWVEVVGTVLWQV